MKKIVTITGGTGGHVILTGLKQYSDQFEIRSIVSMADDGGRTGQLRDALGVLPAGDLRRCLAALSENNYLRELLIYNFKGNPGNLQDKNLGDLIHYALKDLYPHQSWNVWSQIFSLDHSTAELFDFKFNGNLEADKHSLGNLIINAAEKYYGNVAEGIKNLSKILKLRGRVYPVSLDNYKLKATCENGEVIFGETKIDLIKEEETRTPISKIELLKQDHLGGYTLNNQVEGYNKSIESIQKAEYIIIGPGDLYTSLGPNLIVKGIAKAIKESKAKVIYVCNLMTKHGETDDYKISDFIEIIEKYLGKKIDYILYNANGLPEEEKLKYAQTEKQYPIKNNLINDQRVISASLISKPDLEKHLIRHDSEKLAQVIMGIINENKNNHF